MDRETSCTGTIIGLGLTLLIWVIIINAIASALAVVICVIGYVIWLLILKPIFSVVGKWADSRPYTPPRSHPRLDAFINALIQTVASLIILLFAIDAILMSSPLIGGIAAIVWIAVFVGIIRRYRRLR